MTFLILLIGKSVVLLNLHNKPISCLMYVDDLSETEDGLPECLQRLNKYSHKWKMTISPKKTKIMIFNKSGRMIKLKIRIGELTIEFCSQCTYLGTASHQITTSRKHKVSFIRTPAEHSLVILRR